MLSQVDDEGYFHFAGIIQYHIFDSRVASDYDILVVQQLLEGNLRVDALSLALDHSILGTSNFEVDVAGAFPFC